MNWHVEGWESVSACSGEGRRGSLGVEAPPPPFAGLFRGLLSLFRIADARFRLFPNRGKDLLGGCDRSHPSA